MVRTRSLQSGIELFSTCPASYGFDHGDYLARIDEVARWSEEAGYRGTLIYTDNRLVDPWLVAQLVVQTTESLCPLVAVQPLYMHPYTGAKMVATLAFLHGRRVYLNMLAGGFKNDLISLGDDTPHVKRYERTIEYTQIVSALLGGGGHVSFAGDYYTVVDAQLGPALPKELHPGILISGSSEEGTAAARVIGATAIRYPGPPDEPVEEGSADVPMGIRVGVIARETSDEAWAVAHERFPADRKGQIAHALAIRASDSKWHQQLSGLAQRPINGTYWLHPFKNYKTFCPYLVGSYEEVGTELARYYQLGFTTFIFDVPPSRQEFDFTDRALSFVATEPFVAV